MYRTALQWLKPLIVLPALALSLACSDDVVLGPQHAPGQQMPGVPGDAPAGPVVLGPAGVRNAADVVACPNLQVTQPSRLALHVYASGVQIYRWNGASWSFVAPDALLFADARGMGVMGTHYAGPAWEHYGGSKVTGAVLERCTPNASAIPWLLLEATSTQGQGVFSRVTFIQRVNTVGGLAPAQPGAVIGEEARVPYTTEYLFYRPQ